MRSKLIRFNHRLKVALFRSSPVPQKVVLGVRPEHMQLTDSADGYAATVDWLGVGRFHEPTCTGQWERMRLR